MIKAKKLKLQKFLPIRLIKKPGKHVSLKKNFIGSKETIFQFLLLDNLQEYAIFFYLMVVFSLGQFTSRTFFLGGCLQTDIN